MPPSHDGAHAHTHGSRILVLDFIRLAAILLMVQGHTLDALMNPGLIVPGTLRWDAWLHLRGLTAPLFLLVSGAATVLGIRFEADGRVARALVRRRRRTALMVTGLGYLLLFPASRIFDLPFLTADIWRGFFQVNILAANGVTLLLLTSLLERSRSIRRYAAWSVGLGLLIILAAPVVTSLDWFAWLPEPVAAYLSFQHGSTFPLFPTSGYMFVGVGVGAVLREVPADRRERAFRRACLGAAAAGLGLGLLSSQLSPGWLPAHDPTRVGYVYSFCRLGMAFLVFGLLAWAVERLPRLAASLAPLGQASLMAYVGHLLLLYGPPWHGGLDTFWPRTLDLGPAVLLVILVEGLTFGGILAWQWTRREWPRLGGLLEATAVLAVVWELVV